MPPGDEYRRKAADMAELSARESNPQVRNELDKLVLSYIRLAEQAEQNARTDIVYEATSRSDQRQPVAQQQQQPQPKEEC